MNPSHPNAGRLVELTADIATAYLSHNHVQSGDIPKVLAEIHGALQGALQLRTASQPTQVKASPAEIRRSITHEVLISFEDGKPYKTLRRHLARLGLTPETYRQKWGLPHDYPMTSADYSKRRSDLARALTLGLPLGEAGAAKHERRPAPEGGAAAGE
ncbi:MAG: MucR family transcriptional regulator [Methylobacterium sp.]|uniref:MucR family transcriptional regulator n=1 Tax=Methylobacterium sp. TaxID=409 RepID=UPI00258F98B0|nr:MucR family transcriptional regulator [Methylobacterium sp.]MBY0295474.1 MucR family transcriptional regulator [Methylobacterium sp.]